MQWFWDGAFFVNENFDIADVAYKYVISGIWTGDRSNRLSIVSRDCPVVGYRLPIPINIVPTCRQIDPVEEGIAYLSYDSGRFANICHDQRNRNTTLLTVSDGIVSGENISSFSSNDPIGGFFGSVGRRLGRFECPKNQKSLTSADNYQTTGEGHQQKIKPPARIIWRRRGVASFILLRSSVYAVRNGLFDLFGGKKMCRRSWLVGALLCADGAGFVLWLGLVP